MISQKNTEEGQSVLPMRDIENIIANNNYNKWIHLNNFRFVIFLQLLWFIHSNKKKKNTLKH